MNSQSRLITLTRASVPAVAAIATYLLFLAATGSPQIFLPLTGSWTSSPNPDGTITVRVGKPDDNPRSRWRYAIGAPFSGVFTETIHETLVGGAHINQSGGYQRLYRDAEGRVRTEQLILGTGSITDGLFFVLLFDPVSGYRYIFDDQHHIAHRAVLAVGDSFKPSLDPPNYGYTLETDPDMRRKPPENNQPQPVTSAEYFNQMWKNVPAVGRKHTTEYPAGFRGAEKAYTMSNEEWFCPELDLRLYLRTSDSRGTERIWSMEDIGVGDPDPALFRIPADYQIVDDAGSVVMILKRHDR
jgi:hypothetical protein